MADSYDAARNANIPEGWIRCAVQDIVHPEKYSCIGGPFGSNLTSKDYVDAPGIPVSRGNNLTLGKERYIDSDFVFVSERKAATLLQNMAFPGDLVFTQRGTIGQVGLIPRRPRFSSYILSQNQMKLRPDESKANPIFLYYYFISPIAQNLIQQNSIGSTIPGFNLGQLRTFPLVLPPLPEQKAIAGVLEALDDKIELNRRTSRTLERVARAIFQAWFVDFEPVKAKAAGARSFPSMPQEFFDALPTCLVKSELGPVPEGWEVGCIGDVVEMRMERINPSEKTTRLLYVPIECISPKSLSLQNWKQGAEAQSSLQCFYRGDILFGAMRPYFHKVCLAPFDGITRTTAFVLVPRKTTHYSYVALLVHDPSTVKYATQHSVGSTIPYAKWERSLSNMPVVVPPESLMQAFEEIVRPMLEPFMQTPFENACLSALRDYLLPKLMNGEVRVAGVGDQVRARCDEI